MKQLITCMFVMMCTFLVAQQPNKAATKELSQALDTEIPLRLEKHKVPGIAIAVIDNGAIIYNKGMGFADADQQLKVDGETGFNVGSMSKMFTAWGIMKLVEAGTIDLDTPVEQYIKRWKLPTSNFDSNKVTVRSLLSHTGGLSVHGYPGFQPNEPLPTIEASLDGENGSAKENAPVEIIMEPQTKFEYSGGGYTILQLLIEEQSGQSFTTYMQEEVFNPLGMNHTSFTIDDTILKHSATPYDENGSQIELERFTAQAAAGLHTTLNDLIKFADASIQGNSILSEKSLMEMRTVNPTTKGRYGLGYMMLPFGKITVKGHAGSNDGWEAAFMIDFDSKSGMIMLSNGSQGKQVLRSTLKQWGMWKMKQLASE